MEIITWLLTPLPWTGYCPLVMIASVGLTIVAAMQVWNLSNRER
jgi:hypothetical protein